MFWKANAVNLYVKKYTRYTVHGRGAKYYPRRECQRPTSRVTLDPRHILEHSLCVHLQAADTVIGVGHVFVNVDEEGRQNRVQNRVPERSFPSR